jgi:hypothetical protein
LLCRSPPSHYPESILIEDIYIAVVKDLQIPAEAMGKGPCGHIDIVGFAVQVVGAARGEIERCDALPEVFKPSD